MSNKTYSIFGAGAAGLYTAWRLLNGKTKDPNNAGKLLQKGDVLELYDWGKYDFSQKHSGSREPGARICTWFYKNNKKNSFVELGGMRYSYWDKTAPKANDGLSSGHRVVTEVIEQLGLSKFSVPFNVTNNQLFYLRSKNFYLNDINSNNPAPYNMDHFGAGTSPDQGFNTVENLAVTANSGPQTRREWCKFYNEGKITVTLSDNSVFQKDDLLKDIGYWNLLYDQLGEEGYEYAADGNGYSSNVINTSSAVSFNMNNEFAPGTQYRTLSIGYSGMFNVLFEQIEQMCAEKGVEFRYYPDTRLHSIVWKNNKAAFTYASRAEPNAPAGARESDAAWMAMPRAAIDLVAQATRFRKPEAGENDVLNHEQVSLYLESAIMQPSYKVGMFFEYPWWSPEYSANPAPYPAQIIGYTLTPDVVAALKKDGFPASAIEAMNQLLYKPYESLSSLVADIENIDNERLTVLQTKQLDKAARNDTIGPSVSSSPIRMVVYFGNNAADQNQTPVYGILASYDDEDNTDFWKQLELEPNQDRKIPSSADTQPIDGPRKVPARMVKMLRKMLGDLHFGPNANYLLNVPEPIDAAYVDWSLPPFNAGYHEWAPHFDIVDVQQKIRKPSLLTPNPEANIFIVGETYSNDQAWVEGAYCTAESVLNDFFDVTPIIDNTEYPFIAPAEYAKQ